MAATILVIEDERLTRTNLINFLLAEGFETLEAPNGRVGIELAQAHMPDLIICDILMPELDGYDVLMTLQQQTQTAAIPFIFLTVSATEDGFRQGLALGADDYLSKPVTSEQLRTAISAQLSKAPPMLGTSTTPLSKKLEGSSTMLQEYSGSSTLPTTMIPPLISAQADTADDVAIAKAKLLEKLCPLLKQRLINLLESVEELQTQVSEKNTAQKLLDEFVQLLSLVNEASALQKSFTSTNAMDLLEVFNRMINDIDYNQKE